MVDVSEALDLVVVGEVIVAGEQRPGAVGMVDGRIVFIGRPEDAPAARRRLDRTGCLLLPGALDVHVHTRSTTDEGITRATAAAAAGGVTTIVDMPYDADHPINSAELLREKAAQVEREAVVDVALFATVAPTGPPPQEEVRAMADAGATAFKLSLFESHPVRFPRLPDDRLYEVFQAIAATGLPAAVHAENQFIVETLTARYREQGPGDLAAHGLARPPVAEAEAIARALELAHWAGVHLHVVHVSIGRGVTLLDRARAGGDPVTAETCLHYLLYTEEEARSLGTHAKINPPLRGREDVEALWQALVDGRLEAVTSDHAPWTGASKQREHFFDAPSGAPGVEVLLPLFLDAARRRELDLAAMLRLVTEGPARCYGLYPRKGRLGLYADADLVCYDPAAEAVVEGQRHQSISGWSPYEGRRYRGTVVTTVAGGAVVYDGGAIVAAPGSGRFVRP
jgi:allantoinase